MIENTFQAFSSIAASMVTNLPDEILDNILSRMNDYEGNEEYERTYLLTLILTSLCYDHIHRVGFDPDDEEQTTMLTKLGKLVGIFDAPHYPLKPTGLKKMVQLLKSDQAPLAVGIRNLSSGDVESRLMTIQRLNDCLYFCLKLINDYEHIDPGNPNTMKANQRDGIIHVYETAILKGHNMIRFESWCQQMQLEIDRETRGDSHPGTRSFTL